MTRAAEILKGERFGRLIAVERRPSRRGYQRWLFRCDCGLEKEITVASVRAGRSKSCGCGVIEAAVKAKTHGLSNAAEYRIWGLMRQRCENPAGRSFDRYGGRGISVCGRWQSFETFWADMGPRPSPKHSIERIDNEEGYSASNCRWATVAEQNANKRSSIRVIVKGREMTLAEAAAIVGINYGCVWQRVRKLGWTAEKALSEPIVPGRRRINAEKKS